MVLEANGRPVMEGCQSGDPEAFRAFFEAHKDRVYSIALRYSGNSTAAMDIAQEIFLKVFSTIRDFRGEAEVETWLYRIAVNACLDFQRRTQRHIPAWGQWIEEVTAKGESILNRLLRAEVEHDVHRIVASLPPEQRIVVVLRYTEGLSYDQIATIVGCSSGTVASRLNRAHKVLERKLSHLRGMVGNV